MEFFIIFMIYFNILGSLSWTYCSVWMWCVRDDPRPNIHIILYLSRKNMLTLYHVRVPACIIGHLFSIVHTYSYDEGWWYILWKYTTYILIVNEVYYICINLDVWFLHVSFSIYVRLTYLSYTIIVSTGFPITKRLWNSTFQSETKIKTLVYHKLMYFLANTFWFDQFWRFLLNGRITPFMMGHPVLVSSCTYLICIIYIHVDMLLNDYDWWKNKWGTKKSIHPPTSQFPKSSLG